MAKYPEERRVVKALLLQVPTPAEPAVADM